MPNQGRVHSLLSSPGSVIPIDLEQSNASIPFVEIPRDSVSDRNVLRARDSCVSPVSGNQRHSDCSWTLGLGTVRGKVFAEAAERGDRTRSSDSSGCCQRRLSRHRHRSGKLAATPVNG
jgi:hypothetical protein